MSYLVHAKCVQFALIVPPINAGEADQHSLKSGQAQQHAWGGFVSPLPKRTQSNKARRLLVYDRFDTGTPRRP